MSGKINIVVLWGASSKNDDISVNSNVLSSFQKIYNDCPKN